MYIVDDPKIVKPIFMQIISLWNAHWKWKFLCLMQGFFIDLLKYCIEDLLKSHIRAEKRSSKIADLTDFFALAFSLRVSPELTDSVNNEQEEMRKKLKFRFFLTIPFPFWRLFEGEGSEEQKCHFLFYRFFSNISRNCIKILDILRWENLILKVLLFVVCANEKMSYRWKTHSNMLFSKITRKRQKIFALDKQIS